MTKRLRVTLLPKPHARINAGMLQGSGHGTLNKAHSCSHPGIFQLSCLKKKKKKPGEKPLQNPECLHPIVPCS